jgi:hypothetical protein
MNRYHARDLLALDADVLWALPEERHVVVFDDGEVVTHTRATITSVYLWEPLRQFPDVPLSSRFHLGDKRFTSKSMLKQINTVIWAIHSFRNEEVDPELLAKLAFQTVNRFYNEFTVRLSAFPATLSMFDVLDVMYHPQIKEANEKVEPTQYSIEEVCYKQIKDVFNDQTQLRGNPLAEAIRSGTLKMDQMLQCVGPRGFMTDIDSTIFPEPITKGYVEGIDSLHDAMIESRSGSKSLLYNKELLRDTEYFNRKTQLIAQYVQRLHPGDCGGQPIDFPVMESLLKTLRGKYHVVNGKLEVLNGDEKHLIGQRIKLRSVLGCRHPDPSGICAVCYGRLSYSVPRGTNIGHISAVSMGDKITSSVLSTKHLDSTSRVEKFNLGKTEAKYLRYRDQDEQDLYLKRELKGKSKRIVVFRNEVQSLVDILMLSSLEDYPVGNASNLTMMQIIVDEGDEGQTSELLRVSLYNRKSSFSKELLEHIAKVGWSHDAKDNVVIDITTFDVSKPFLSLPFKHVNMYEVMKRIQSFLHSGSDTETKRLGERGDDSNRGRKNFLKNYKDPVEALVVFATMLNEKLSINLVHCEVLVYAMMVRSATQRDYRLPIPGISGVFEKYNTLMMNRSLADAMAFEKQDRPLINPGSFIYTKRNDHPYDLVMLGGRLT